MSILHATYMFGPSCQAPEEQLGSAKSDWGDFVQIVGEAERLEATLFERAGQTVWLLLAAWVA